MLFKGSNMWHGGCLCEIVEVRQDIACQFVALDK